MSPTKRGPGRPSLNPSGGETQPRTVRLSNAQLAELDRIIAIGLAPDQSGALRWLIDRSIGRSRRCAGRS